ncbi:hypothetical protein FB45DRAFT_1115946 [Roridomyces roridus]|uniref:Uncharacterized protein n=1 Tax=Roridomyces roridus TaxID=1738132 RepID=A0AAD7FV28_9AGAR|nr:hypothetical protein FB45DRAFT_1115946 [Roridomyces roridus]
MEFPPDLMFSALTWSGNPVGVREADQFEEEHVAALSPAPSSTCQQEPTSFNYTRRAWVHSIDCNEGQIMAENSSPIFAICLPGRVQWPERLEPSLEYDYKRPSTGPPFIFYGEDFDTYGPGGNDWFHGLYFRAPDLPGQGQDDAAPSVLRGGDIPTRGRGWAGDWAMSLLELQDRKESLERNWGIEFRLEALQVTESADAEYNEDDHGPSKSKRTISDYHVRATVLMIRVVVTEKQLEKLRELQISLESESDSEVLQVLEDDTDDEDEFPAQNSMKRKAEIELDECMDWEGAGGMAHPKCIAPAAYEEAVSVQLQKRGLSDVDQDAVEYVPAVPTLFTYTRHAFTGTVSYEPDEGVVGLNVSPVMSICLLGRVQWPERFRSSPSNESPLQRTLTGPPFEFYSVDVCNDSYWYPEERLEPQRFHGVRLSGPDFVFDPDDCYDGPGWRGDWVTALLEQSEKRKSRDKPFAEMNKILWTYSKDRERLCLWGVELRFEVLDVNEFFDERKLDEDSEDGNEDEERAISDYTARATILRVFVKKEGLACLHEPDPPVLEESDETEEDYDDSGAAESPGVQSASMKRKAEVDPGEQSLDAEDAGDPKKRLKK